MQGEHEGASLAGIARDAEFLAQLLHDLVGDGQPQPRALALMGLVGLVEALEYVRQVVRRDAGPRILHRDADQVRRGARR